MRAICDLPGDFGTAVEFFREHCGWPVSCSKLLELPAHSRLIAAEVPPMIRSLETILVVHEDEALRAHVSRVLRAEGYRAIPARHSVEGQGWLERHGSEVDLLLIDLAPPVARDYHLGIPLEALW